MAEALIKQFDECFRGPKIALKHMAEFGIINVFLRLEGMVHRVEHVCHPRSLLDLPQVQLVRFELAAHANLLLELPNTIKPSPGPCPDTSTINSSPYQTRLFVPTSLLDLPLLRQSCNSKYSYHWHVCHPSDNFAA